VRIYPPVDNPYSSLTPAELAAFGIGPAQAPNNDDDGNDDEEAANGDEEMEDNE
jgi:hypothetical protein